jgi:hypothetical protein
LTVPASRPAPWITAEEPIAVRVEVVWRLPDLEHVDLVPAIGGVKQSPLGLACARGIELCDDAVVILS